MFDGSFHAQIIHGIRSVKNLSSTQSDNLLRSYFKDNRFSLQFRQSALRSQKQGEQDSSSQLVDSIQKRRAKVADSVYLKNLVLQKRTTRKEAIENSLFNLLPSPLV